MPSGRKRSQAPGDVQGFGFVAIQLHYAVEMMRRTDQINKYGSGSRGGLHEIQNHIYFSNDFLFEPFLLKQLECPTPNQKGLACFKVTYWL